MESRTIVTLTSQPSTAGLSLGACAYAGPLPDMAVLHAIAPPPVHSLDVSAVIRLKPPCADFGTSGHGSEHGRNLQLPPALSCRLPVRAAGVSLDQGRSPTRPPLSTDCNDRLIYYIRSSSLSSDSYSSSTSHHFVQTSHLTINLSLPFNRNTLLAIVYFDP